ncbi:MAG TPA: AMP-binding protein, partial [Microbacteriaceae bacterium]|nr:AMP-binding protein [Microbacteriaceae bacterium]
MPFTQKILEIAQSHPNRVALADSRDSLSYGDLVLNSPALYAAIEQLLLSIEKKEASYNESGIKANSRTVPTAIGDIPVVMISLERALEAGALVAMLAGYKIISSVLDPSWPLNHRIRSVRESGARVLVTDDEGFVEALHKNDWHGAAVTLAQLKELIQKLSNRKAKKLENAVDSADLQTPKVRRGDEPFILIFTSGTTDAPKAFLRTRDSWRVNLRVSRKYLYAGCGMGTIAPGPLAYSLTLYALVEVLGTGGTIWLQSRFDPVEAVNLIDEGALERLVAVPAVLPALQIAARRKTSNLLSLKNAIVGGANLSSKLRKDFKKIAQNCEILSYYGAAEIGFIAYSKDGAGDLLNLFDGVEVQVRDSKGQKLPDGELGTLYVRVSSQGDQYISASNNLKNAELLITGPDGWSTVNDQARLINGRLSLEGRAGDIAVTGGHNVS